MCKKIWLLIICVVIAISACACSSSASAPSGTPAAKPEAVAEEVKAETESIKDGEKIGEDQKETAPEETKPKYAFDVDLHEIPSDLGLATDDPRDAGIIAVKDLNTGKRGFINGRCEIVVPVEYEEFAGLGGVFFHEDKTLIRKGNTWTVVYSDGTLGSTIELDEGIYVRGITENMMLIEKDTKYGYADTKGNVVIPLGYDCRRIDADAFFRNGRAIVDVGESKTLINSDNRCLLDFWSSINYLTDELLLINGYGHYGAADYDGNMIVPVEFDEVRIVSNGALIQTKLGGKYGYYDTDRNEILSPEYDSLEVPYHGVFAAKKGDAYSLIDTSGDVIISEGKYDYLGNSASFDGMITACRDGKYGVIDQNEAVIIPFEYDDLGKMAKRNFAENGISYACSQGQYGFVDGSGSIVIPFEYDNVNNYTQSGFAVVTRNGLKGVIDKDNNIVVPIENDKVSIYSDIPFVTIENSQGECIYCTENGKTLNGDYSYDAIYPIGGKGLLCVVKDKKAGIMNMQGDIIVPIEYDYFEVFGSNFLKGKKGDTRYIGEYK